MKAVTRPWSLCCSASGGLLMEVGTRDQGLHRDGSRPADRMRALPAPPTTSITAGPTRCVPREPSC